MNKKVLLFLVSVVVFAILFRVIPFRKDNFNPIYTISLFSGFLFANNKKWSFVAPLLAMLISDIIYQVLYINKLGTVQGFYGWWQLTQYASILAISIVGFYIKKVNAAQVGLASIIAATLFFVLSNFFVWLEGMGYQHSYTFSGLVKCFADGIPFYKATLMSTLIFSAIVFGIYSIIIKTQQTRQTVKA